LTLRIHIITAYTPRPSSVPPGYVCGGTGDAGRRALNPGRRFMKTIIILLLSLSYLPCAATAHAQGAAGKPLDLASAPASALKLQAVGVVYTGEEVSAGDVCLHAEGVEGGGRTFNWSDAMTDGLFVEDRLGGGSKVYQPYKLARRAGWYRGGDGSDESEPNNNIWGLFVAGGKVWMGTDGLGVL
jgi:hypothetical protein